MKKEHLYVAKFSDGTVKVGRSIRPMTRLAEHRNAAACFGIEVVAFESMPCAGDALKAEEHLLVECRARALSVRRNEWFSGLDYMEAATLATISASVPFEVDPLRDEIRRAGGAAAIARHLGITVDAIRDWNAIPQRHAAAVADMQVARSSVGEMSTKMYSRLLARVASRVEALQA